MRKHWVRVVCDEKINDYIECVNQDIFTILEISGQNWKSKFTSKDYISLSYPEFDIEKNQKHKNKYDLIILEHVLEHISNPRRSLINIFNLLNNGGRLILVTPFLIKIHSAPNDYTRWTMDGIKLLLNEVGFKDENIKIDQWGNKSAVIRNLDKWIKYNPLIHSLKNQKEFPTVVWAFAKKHYEAI
jgi:SAM-dependent methyltransferase